MEKLWYGQAENLYNRIVPLRRQTESDMRPVGERRRKHERIAKEGDSYIIKYYNHNVVTYHADGRMVVGLPAWTSPKVADYLTRYTPFRFTKQYNNIWMTLPVSGGKLNCVPVIGDVTVWRQDNGIHHNVIGIVKRAVNRKNAKAARARIKPFVDYCTTMLSISDGWILSSTANELLDGHSKRMAPFDLLHDILTSSDEEWPRLCVQAAQTLINSMNMHGRINYGDQRYSATQLNKALYKFIEQYSPDMYDPKVVDVTDKPLCEVVSIDKGVVPNA